MNIARTILWIALALLAVASTAPRLSALRDGLLARRLERRVQAGRIRKRERRER